MAKKSGNSNSTSVKDELSLDQLDAVSGGAVTVVTDNNNAQMLTDLNLTQPNALQPHAASSPGVPSQIETGAHVGTTAGTTATGWEATAVARTGVDSHQQLGSNVNWTGQAGADTDASFYVGAGMKTQAGGHAIASSSLDLGGGGSANTVARADGDVNMKLGLGGLSGGVEGGVRASQNVAFTESHNVGGGVTMHDSTVAEAGVKAEAGAQAKLTPSTLTVGVNSFAGAYTSIGETVSAEGGGYGGSLGVQAVSPGSVGIGYTPVIGVQDDKLNIGMHGALAVGIGGAVIDANVSIDTSHLRDGAQIVAHGATDAAHTVAHGATDAANTVSHGAANAANTVSHGATDAAHTVAHGASNAAHTVAHGASSVANTVAHGATDAAHTVAHGASHAAHTMAHRASNAAHTVAHGATDAAHTVAHGASNAAHTVAHGASNAAHTVAHGASNAAHTVAHGASNAAHTVAHGITSAAHSVGHAFSSAGHAIAHVFCHTAGTLIAMADGTYKPVEQLKMGDETLLGGEVLGRGEVLATDLYSYRGTVLNGRHAVFEDGQWLRVEQSALATQLDVPPATVYPIVTANHLLVCEQYICADLAEYDEDIGAAGRLAKLNADTAPNAELSRMEERYEFAKSRAA